jgi:hypothetical protein
MILVVSHLSVIERKVNPYCLAQRQIWHDGEWSSTYTVSQSLELDGGTWLPPGYDRFALCT